MEIALDAKLGMKRKPGHYQLQEDGRAVKRRKTSNYQDFMCKTHSPQNPNNGENYNSINGKLTVTKNGKIMDVQNFVSKLLSSRTNGLSHNSDPQDVQKTFKRALAIPLEVVEEPKPLLKDPPQVEETANNKHHLNSLEQKLYKHKCQESTVPGCDAGLFGIESLHDMPTALIVNLHRKGFSINSQKQCHAYKHPVMRSITTAINLGVLVPELAALLEEAHCQFVEGCAILEVRDYRNEVSRGSTPRVERILLRPTQATLAGDLERLIQTNKLNLSDDERIYFEKTLLEKLNAPVCLDVSKDFTECQVLYGLSYNINKYNYRAKKGLLARKSTCVLPRRKQPTPLPEMEAKSYPRKRSKLYTFLKNHSRDKKDLYSIYNDEFHRHQALHANHPSMAARGQTTADQLPITVNSHPIVPNGIPQPAQFVRDRSITFGVQGHKGRNSRTQFVVRFDMKQSGPGIYHGVMRPGTRTPQGQMQGQPIAFGIGSAQAVHDFIQNLYVLEGETIVADNANPHTFSYGRNANALAHLSQSVMRNNASAELARYGRGYAGFSNQGNVGFQYNRGTPTYSRAGQMAQRQQGRGAVIDRNRMYMRANAASHNAPIATPRNFNNTQRGMAIANAKGAPTRLQQAGATRGPTTRPTTRGPTTRGPTTRGPTTRGPTTRGHNPASRSKRGMK